MPDNAYEFDWLSAFVIAGCLLAWAAIAAQLARRRPIVMREPRRVVPWDGGAVVVVLLTYFAFQLASGYTVWVIVGPINHGGPEESAVAAQAEPSTGEPDAETEATETTAHPIVRLLGRRSDPWTLALCAVAALVVAPLAEEFYFRLVLQGWLEARERSWRNRQAWLRGLPRGMLPITLPALPFALMHTRTAEVEFSPEGFVLALISNAAASLLTVGMTVFFFRRVYGATADDLGFSANRLLHDVGVGLFAVLAVLAPLLFLQQSLYAAELWLVDKGWMDAMVAPDPLPLFLLAVVLGFLYRRTHRLTPSVVLHMGFNGTMLLLLLLTLAG